MNLSKYVLAPPIAPGEVLRKRILDSKLTQDALAEAMKVSRFSINQIINGKRSITPEMALRLARVTSTTTELWLNLQRDLDIYLAKQKLGSELEKLPVLRKPKRANELYRNL